MIRFYTWQRYKNEKRETIRIAETLTYLCFGTLIAFIFADDSLNALICLNINNSMYQICTQWYFILFLYQIKIHKVMLVINSKEFRENQKKYFDSVDSGEQVIIQRGKNRSYKLVPVTEHDICMTEEEFYEKIGRSIHQAKEVKTLRVSSSDDLKKLLYD